MLIISDIVHYNRYLSSSIEGLVVLVCGNMFIYEHVCICDNNRSPLEYRLSQVTRLI